MANDFPGQMKFFCPLSKLERIISDDSSSDTEIATAMHDVFQLVSDDAWRKIIALLKERYGKKRSGLILKLFRRWGF